MNHKFNTGIYRTTEFLDAIDLERELARATVVVISPVLHKWTPTEWIVSVQKRTPKIEQIVRAHKPKSAVEILQGASK